MKRGVVRLSKDPWLHMYRPTRYDCGETDRDLSRVVTYGPPVESAQDNGSNV